MQYVCIDTCYAGFLDQQCEGTEYEQYVRVIRKEFFHLM